MTTGMRHMTSRVTVHVPVYVTQSVGPLPSLSVCDYVAGDDRSMDRMQYVFTTCEAALSLLVVEVVLPAVLNRSLAMNGRRTDFTSWFLLAAIINVLTSRLPMRDDDASDAADEQKPPWVRACMKYAVRVFITWLVFRLFWRPALRAVEYILLDQYLAVTKVLGGDVIVSSCLLYASGACYLITLYKTHHVGSLERRSPPEEEAPGETGAIGKPFMSVSQTGLADVFYLPVEETAIKMIRVGEAGEMELDHSVLVTQTVK